MSYTRTPFYILHVYPVGGDDASEYVRMAESPAPGHEHLQSVQHQGLVPRDSVFACLSVYRNMYADVVVHTMGRV
jgi:hypothetical protein